MTVNRLELKILSPLVNAIGTSLYLIKNMTDKDEQDRKYISLGLRIVGEFGAIIAVPVVLLSLLGQHLDRRYETAPLFLVIGFILAAVFSGLSIWRRAKRFGQEYEAIDPKTQSESDSSQEETNNHTTHRED